MYKTITAAALLAMTNAVKMEMSDPNEGCKGEIAQNLYNSIHDGNSENALKALNDVNDDCSLDLGIKGLHQGFSSQASALHMAIEYNMSEVAIRLIEEGANVNEKVPGLHNQAPLAWVCHGSVHENQELIRKLMDAGADPNQQDDGGWTALHQCAAENRFYSIETILNYGRYDKNLRNGGNETALGTAIVKESFQAA